MSTSQQADPLIGRLVDGRYRVRARIARGGMATVYVATDLRLERRVALKVMHGHLSDDAVFQSRFIQEARSAARLADPHVVNVFDQGQDMDMAYLVMEYLPGITLRELLREQRRLTVPQAITIMDATLAGLAAAHRAHIVHRDVKPENILLAEDGRIKIGDFGLARATTANTATGQMLLGTIAYLAPELVTRGQADARSDIYALGIMLYEMLTGEQPYQGEQPMQIAYRHATDSVPRPSVKNPQVPEQLDELVLWATEKVPDDRPLDATVMLTRLREIERELGVTPAAAQATSPVSTIEQGGSGELTKVMPAASVLTGTAPTVTVDNATRLRRRQSRRRTRGVWLTIIVILLAGIAGGSAWWFGSGPGSLVAVPDVAGKTMQEATDILLAQTLIAAPGEGEYDFDVPPGLVLHTSPSPGDRIDQDSTVTVVLSLGPQPHDIQALAGVPESEVRTVLADAQVTVGDSLTEFSDQPDDAVLYARLEPRAGGDAVDLTPGGTVLEGDTVILTVSLGAIPDVVGLSVGDATQRLTSAGLVVSPTPVEEFSDDFASGQVISIGSRAEGGNWRPNDTVTFTVSKGPQPVPVPDVRGMTRDEAKGELTDRGFKYTYSPFWDAVLDGLTEVEAQAPSSGSTCTANGSECIPGTTIVLTITGSF